ncbi:VOC family protein [Pedococcus sp. 5OH_020]|uniref:VOC family protein n=1 Tax=Pedococcus sp. 5OH_020 TaxID=2989814 RepID=UPI0022E9F23C|nr:VOC family protein [Pedococcus sp. 5OH_020]
MALRVGSIVVTVADVARAMAFWAGALDLVPREAPEPDWVVLRPRVGTGPNLSLALGESRPTYFPHVHLDLYTADRAQEVRRLLGLGARLVEDWPYPQGDHDYVVLEDPDGNRFCVVHKPDG